MSLIQKVQAVEEAYALLDQEMSDFRGWAKISCLLGCGRCCTKNDIEATVLEFLPFAYHLFLLNEAEEWLQKLKQHPSATCIVFTPGEIEGAGACSQYPYRGLVCRLFGFSARLNKYAKREFVSCKPIKTELPQAYNDTVEGIAAGHPVPMIGNHYMRLHAIDPELTRKFYPINEAIRRAIETVLQYHSYTGYYDFPEPGAA